MGQLYRGENSEVHPKNSTKWRSKSDLCPGQIGGAAQADPGAQVPVVVRGECLEAQTVFDLNTRSHMESEPFLQEIGQPNSLSVETFQIKFRLFKPNYFN